MRFHYLVFLIFFSGVFALTLDLCNYKASEIVIGTDFTCSDGIDPENASLYINEDYYVCGIITKDGMPITDGIVTAYEDSIMKRQSIPIRGLGKFYLQGYTDTTKHRVYYINLEFGGCSSQMPLEVKDKCIQLPPSTIQAVPNSVEKSRNFELQVMNSDKNLTMNIYGLKEKITSEIKIGEIWKKSFSSSQCCDSPPCSCELNFVFSDSKHRLCYNDATKIELRVIPEQNPLVIYQEQIQLTILIILAIVIIGTVGSIALANV